MKKLCCVLLALVLSATLLAACGGAAGPGPAEAASGEAPASAANSGAEGGEPRSWDAPLNDFLTRFPSETANETASVEGGVLRVALASSAPFPGTFHRGFANDLIDYQVIQWFTEGLLTVDEQYRYTQDGPASYTYDEAAKTVTLALREGLTWHDGEPLTLDDLIYAYEVLAHPEYENSIFYEGQIKNVVGAEAYHAGEAETIEGMELSEDGLELTIEFADFRPSILMSGFFVHPFPRHYYGDLELADIAGDDRTRKTPIGFGPFRVTGVVPGESVTLEAFEDYWQGAPGLAGVLLEVVNPDLIPTAMQAGQYDVAEFPSMSYGDYQQPENFSYLGRLETWYGFTGFVLGHLDAETGASVLDEDAALADVRLRQAIGYAVDNASLCAQLYSGLRFPASTALPATASAFIDPAQAGYTYDPDRANALLDEAGYLDVDGDGFRENPKGEPFTLTWLVAEGEGADTVAMYKMQNWADVGLRVELSGGQPMELISFYAALQDPEPAYDLFDHAWLQESDPSPALYWSSTAFMNLGHYANDEMDAALAALNDEDCFDEAVLRERYAAWQQLFFEQAPGIATTWRGTLFAVNERVKNYSVTPSSIRPTLHLVELTAEQPVAG